MRLGLVCPSIQCYFIHTTPVWADENHYKGCDQKKLNLIAPEYSSNSAMFSDYRGQRSCKHLLLCCQKSILEQKKTWIIRNPVCYTIIMDFTWLKTGSIGFKSGLYGGRNHSRAPTLLTICTTSSMWRIEALSMITMERALDPLKNR